MDKVVGERLATEEPEAAKTFAEREAEYDAFVDANFKRNYIANYMHGMLGMTGMRIFSAPTFLPAYLHAASGSNAIVGLAQALQQVGMIISPVIGASLAEKRKHVLPLAVLIGGIARLQILFVALAGWFLTGQTLVLALLLFITLFGLFMGAQRVVFQTLLSKVIPIRRRGRLQAWRNATGGAIAAVLSYVAGRYLIDTKAFGNGYSTTFLLACILTTAGILILQAIMKEPESLTVRPHTSLMSRMKEFPALMAADRSYAWFIVVQCLAIGGRMAVPFYILYASATIKMDGATIGLLSLSYLGADTVSNLLWGYLGDKKGFRIVMVASLIMWVAATVALLNFHTLAATAVAFFGLGASQSGYQMSSQTMVLEFGDRAEVSMRLALSATAEGVMGSIGPLVGGLMAATLGYPILFWTSMALLAASLGLLLISVPDPRFRKAAAAAPVAV